MVRPVAVMLSRQDTTPQLRHTRCTGAPALHYIIALYIRFVTGTCFLAFASPLTACEQTEASIAAEHIKQGSKVDEAFRSSLAPLLEWTTKSTTPNTYRYSTTEAAIRWNALTRGRFDSSHPSNADAKPHVAPPHHISPGKSLVYIKMKKTTPTIYRFWTFSGDNHTNFSQRSSSKGSSMGRSSVTTTLSARKKQDNVAVYGASKDVSNEDISTGFSSLMATLTFPEQHGIPKSLDASRLISDEELAASSMAKAITSRKRETDARHNHFGLKKFKGLLALSFRDRNLHARVASGKRPAIQQHILSTGEDGKGTLRARFSELAGRHSSFFEGNERSEREGLIKVHALPVPEGHRQHDKKSFWIGRDGIVHSRVRNVSGGQAASINFEKLVENDYSCDSTKERRQPVGLKPDTQSSELKVILSSLLDSLQAVEKLNDTINTRTAERQLDQVLLRGNRLHEHATVRLPPLSEPQLKLHFSPSYENRGELENIAERRIIDVVNDNEIWEGSSHKNSVSFHNSTNPNAGDAVASQTASVLTGKTYNWMKNYFSGRISRNPRVLYIVGETRQQTIPLKIDTSLFGDGEEGDIKKGGRRNTLTLYEAIKKVSQDVHGGDLSHTMQTVESEDAKTFFDGAGEDNAGTNTILERTSHILTDETSPLEKPGDGLKTKVTFIEDDVEKFPCNEVESILELNNRQGNTIIDRMEARETETNDEASPTMQLRSFGDQNYHKQNNNLFARGWKSTYPATPPEVYEKIVRSSSATESLDLRTRFVIQARVTSSAPEQNDIGKAGSENVEDKQADSGDYSAAELQVFVEGCQQGSASVPLPEKAATSKGEAIRFEVRTQEPFNSFDITSGNKTAITQALEQSPVHNITRKKKIKASKPQSRSPQVAQPVSARSKSPAFRSGYSRRLGEKDLGYTSGDQFAADEKKYVQARHGSTQNVHRPRASQPPTESRAKIDARSSEQRFALHSFMSSKKGFGSHAVQTDKTGDHAFLLQNQMKMLRDISNLSAKLGKGIIPFCEMTLTKSPPIRCHFFDTISTHPDILMGMLHFRRVTPLFSDCVLGKHQGAKEARKSAESLPSNAQSAGTAKRKSILSSPTVERGQTLKEKLEFDCTTRTVEVVLNYLLDTYQKILYHIQCKDAESALQTAVALLPEVSANIHLLVKALSVHETVTTTSGDEDNADVRLTQDKFCTDSEGVDGIYNRKKLAGALRRLLFYLAIAAQFETSLQTLGAILKKTQHSDLPFTPDTESTKTRARRGKRIYQE